MNTCRVLVVGYGSIGSRHAALAAGLGHHVHVVSRNANCPFERSETLAEVASGDFDLIVIASRTHEHYDSLAALLKSMSGNRILVEKPLFHKTLPLPEGCSDEFVFTAYNLRFHPLVRRALQILEGQRLLSIQAYVGQYLPVWRPGRDYRQSYSCRSAEGGGVLNDLSHELDLVQYLAGPWVRVAAIGGKYSHLAGDSEDLFSLVLACERCPCVSLQMNYLDRISRRTMLINTDDVTIHLDFIDGTLRINGGQTQMLPCERDYTYRAQLKAMAEGETAILCTASEGLRTVRLISAAKQAAKEGIWVPT